MGQSRGYKEPSESVCDREGEIFVVTELTETWRSTVGADIQVSRLPLGHAIAKELFLARGFQINCVSSGVNIHSFVFMLDSALAAHGSQSRSGATCPPEAADTKR